MNRTSFKNSFRSAVSIAFLGLAYAVPTFAAPLIEQRDGIADLEAVYATRPDLQSAFPGEARGANAVMRKAGMPTLVDWAQRYGYKEYPEKLSDFAPLPPALRRVVGATSPVLKSNVTFDFDSVSASSVFVIDATSREVLVSKNATVTHPMASISKLMTALVVLDRKPAMAKRLSIMPADEVGGARLSITKGDTLSVLELLNVTLVASANNTANALARSTGLAKPAFIAAMNAKAAELGLTRTVFEDPTGIEVGNISTAEEIAALGLEAFSRDHIRRATTTSRYPLMLARGRHNLKNTNEILNNADNGIEVMGGKTGYIDESKWNLVVKMRNARRKPILVVVLGSDTKAQSFKDAERVGRWVWSNYDWTK